MRAKVAKSKRVETQPESALDRVCTIGFTGAAAIDLLAVGLSSSPSKVAACEQIAREMLHGATNFRTLSSLDLMQLQGSGLDRHEAIRALAWMELGRKLSAAPGMERSLVGDPKAVAELLADLRDRRQEHFVSLLLDSQNRLLRKHVVHIGTLTSSIVGAREVFREAIREGASSLILAHNHPSGDPTPSPEDIYVTKKLVQVGELLDIPVLDHVVLGDNREVSMKQRGLM